MRVSPDPHGAPRSARAAWASARLSASLSVLAVVTGVLGTLLALWPVLGVPTSIGACVLVLSGWYVGRRARRDARARGERAWRAMLALAVNAISILLVGALTLTGGAVSAVRTFGPHRGSPGPWDPYRDETSWLDTTDSSGTISGRTLVAFGVGLVAIVALGAAHEAGIVDRTSDDDEVRRCADDDCHAPASPDDPDAARVE